MRFALLALLAVLAGCGGGTDAAPTGAETASTGAAPTTATPPSTAPAAPRVAGTTLDGERVSLDDFRGMPVLVNVWSSW